MGASWDDDPREQMRRAARTPRHRPWIDGPIAWTLIVLIVVGLAGLGLLGLALLNP